MRNLAGDSRATERVTRELERCGIPVVQTGAAVGVEVKAAVYGQLGPFSFKRAWYYYRVNGPVPIAVARQLYEDPAGRTDIRVAGHCGCPPPEEPWTTSRNPETGKKIVAAEKRAEFDEIGEDLRQKLLARFEEESEWGDPSQGEVFVEDYHIDSELGLYLFVQAVKDLVEQGVER